MTIFVYLLQKGNKFQVVKKIIKMSPLQHKEVEAPTMTIVYLYV